MVFKYCNDMKEDTHEKLNILWTTDSKDTFLNMLSMYATNSKIQGWWDEVNVIIWGASTKLAGIDPLVQAEILEMIKSGVSLEACKDCADNFEVTKMLEKLGVTVRYMGEPLTRYLKNGEKVLTI